ncbi:hypothetical protein BO71DRAFT_477528, partial [Aspergillus ellipticus CBS 707.79]
HPILHIPRPSLANHALPARRRPPPPNASHHRRRKRAAANFTHMDLHQPVDACAHEPLSELLMGFGILLPSQNLCLERRPGHAARLPRGGRAQRRGLQRVQSDLHRRAQGQIKWVDALACHLEFNSSTRELSLFRFPSFCRLALASASRGCVQACATTSTLRCQWATEEDVDQLLREVLLSYRLLLGQTKRARRVFRAVDPFVGRGPGAGGLRDPLLGALCGGKGLCDCRSVVVVVVVVVVQKERYYHPRDFPVLRYRIAVLR